MRDILMWVGSLSRVPVGPETRRFFLKLSDGMFGGRSETKAVVQFQARILKEGGWPCQRTMCIFCQQIKSDER